MVPVLLLGQAAVAYHPEHHSFDQPGLKGRHSAGAGFLRGYLEHAEVERFCFLVDGPDERDHLRSRLEPMQPFRRPVEAVARERPERLIEIGALQLGDVMLSRAAWSRSLQGDQAYSLVGLTHSISSLGAIEELGAYLTAPVQPWDALICTSRAVRDEVMAALDSYGEHLARRLNATPPPGPQLPIVPLGVRTEDFRANAERRAAFRARLGAAAEDVVIMFIGRLSHHSKANPAPLVLAAHRAAERTSKRLLVTFVGQFSNKAQRAVFISATAFAPGLEIRFLPGEDEELVRQAWRGGDVFASLSDNVQESFGLTVIEAMAAGLPVVASDWDGYRDTVQHGETGFLVPTLTPPAGAGTDLAERHRTGLASYDRYISALSLSTAVDVDAAAEALARLANEPDLRARMGMAARAAAEARFDWRHVIRAHQELWAELEEIRRAGRSSSAVEHPLHRDPYALFSDHPTRVIGARDSVEARGASYLDQLLVAKLTAFGSHDLLLGPEGIRALVTRLQAGPAEVDALISDLSPDGRRRTLRTLAWLAKFGVARVTPHP